MAQSNFPQIERRGSAETHLAAGLHWNDMLATQGYVYLGPVARGNTRWVRPWKPESILCVPSVGDSYVLDNYCVHASGQVVKETDLPTSAKQSMVCPYHSFSYDQGGAVRGCGRMEGVRPQMLVSKQLERRTVQTWNGFAFELGSDQELARERLTASLTFFDQCLERLGLNLGNVCHRVKARTASEPQAADMLTGLINYLDIDHIDDIHRKTLAPFVNMNAYHSERDPNGAGVVQWMGLHPEWFQTEIGQLYQESNLTPPQYGAVWGMTPEGFMFEWYPDVWVFSQCFPVEDRPWESTFHHDFLYASGLSDAYVEAHQDVFRRTGQEDMHQCSATTRFLRRQLKWGYGDRQWGCIGPQQEDHAAWMYRMVQQRLQVYHARQTQR